MAEEQTTNGAGSEHDPVEVNPVDIAVEQAVQDTPAASDSDVVEDAVVEDAAVASDSADSDAGADNGAEAPQGESRVEEGDEPEATPREPTAAELARLAAQQARENDPRAKEPVMASAIEAILFASDGPVRTSDIIAVVEKVEKRPVHESVVHAALEEYARELAERGAAIVPTPVARGWELRTHPAVAEYVRTMYERKPVKLSRAAMEVLSIVAYRQPCTRADVDDIRGVDCSSSLRQLCQRDLVRIIGRADDLGRPLIYGTTKEFLRFFGLESLSDLPTLKEFAELSEEHLETLAELDDENARIDAEQQRQVAEDEPSEGSAFVDEDSAATDDAVVEVEVPDEQAVDVQGTGGDAADTAPIGVADDDGRCGGNYARRPRRIMSERLQKFLARAGVASRRRSEELIKAGRVKVNGKLVTEMGGPR